MRVRHKASGIVARVVYIAGNGLIHIDHLLLTGLYDLKEFEVL